MKKNNILKLPTSEIFTINTRLILINLQSDNNVYSICAWSSVIEVIEISS